jgi:hypothetical protein
MKSFKKKNVRPRSLNLNEVLHVKNVFCTHYKLFTTQLFAFASLTSAWRLPASSVGLGILLELGWHTIPFVRGFLIPEVIRKTT